MKKLTPFEYMGVAVVVVLVALLVVSFLPTTPTATPTVTPTPTSTSTPATMIPAGNQVASANVGAATPYPTAIFPIKGLNCVPWEAKTVLWRGVYRWVCPETTPGPRPTMAPVPTSTPCVNDGTLGTRHCTRVDAGSSILVANALPRAAATPWRPAVSITPAPMPTLSAACAKICNMPRQLVGADGRTGCQICLYPTPPRPAPTATFDYGVWDNITFW